MRFAVWPVQWACFWPCVNTGDCSSGFCPSIGCFPDQSSAGSWRGLSVSDQSSLSVYLVLSGAWPCKWEFPQSRSSWTFSSVFSVSSPHAPSPCTVTRRPTKCSKLGQLQGSILLVPAPQDPCPLLPEFYCLETCCSIYFVSLKKNVSDAFVLGHCLLHVGQK